MNSYWIGADLLLEKYIVVSNNSTKTKSITTSNAINIIIESHFYWFLSYNNIIYT